MLRTKGKQGQVEQAQENQRDEERNSLPWIKKYLEMADLLIRGVKCNRARRNRSRPDSLTSNAIRSPKQTG